MSKRDNDNSITYTPNKSEAVDISSTDHTFSTPYPTHIYCGTGGTLIATLEKDSSAQTYTNVPDGGIVLGRFKSVTKTSTTTAAMVARWYE